MRLEYPPEAPLILDNLVRTKFSLIAILFSLLCCPHYILHVMYIYHFLYVDCVYVSIS